MKLTGWVALAFIVGGVVLILSSICLEKKNWKRYSLVGFSGVLLGMALLVAGLLFSF